MPMSNSNNRRRHSSISIPKSRRKSCREGFTVGMPALLIRWLLQEFPTLNR